MHQDWASEESRGARSGGPNTPVSDPCAPGTACSRSALEELQGAAGGGLGAAAAVQGGTGGPADTLNQAFCELVAELIARLPPADILPLRPGGYLVLRGGWRESEPCDGGDSRAGDEWSVPESVLHLLG
ncbi:hypothetical protein ABPG75_008417 [Micractinium tetrahymenae]